MNAHRHYISAAGYAAIMAWYEATITTITVPYQRHTVATRYGETHIITAGSPTSPPLLLLHGTNVNALTWRRQIIELADEFYVVAPDIIGFAGRSAPVRLSYHDDGYALWLYDVLDALGIERAVFIGSSAGGYFALKPAGYAPERCAGVVLMNPCGLTHFRGLFALFEYQITADIVGWFGRRFIATQATARRVVRLGTSPHIDPDDESVELSLLLVRHYRRYHPPTPMQDADLRRVTSPVLLLLSEHERFLPLQAVIRRAESIFPDVTTQIITNAGHDMNKEQPAQVLRHMRAFFTRIGWCEPLVQPSD